MGFLALQPITGTPLANGSAAAGTSGYAARADHVHPSSTLALLNQTFTTPLLVVGGTNAQTYTVPGATVGMSVVVNPRAATAYGPQLYAWVSAANTVSVELRALVAIAAGTINIDIRVIS